MAKCKPHSELTGCSVETGLTVVEEKLVKMSCEIRADIYYYLMTRRGLKSHDKEGTADDSRGGLTVRDLLYEPCKAAVSLAFNG